MDSLFRFREWMADHVRGVQYPRMTQEPRYSPQKFQWKNQMPWEKRLFIGAASLLLLMVSIPLMVAILLFMWAFLTSI